MVESFSTKVLSDFDYDIEQCASALRIDQLVGMPTETVYGLAACAFSQKAALEIFKVKGRPLDNPLIVHISDIEMLESFIDMKQITPLMHDLMNRFWPGPITFLLPKLPNTVPDAVTCGLSTVGVRMPSHPLALKLIRKAGFPLAAPSANSSGKPSPTQAGHVMHDLNGKIPFILDGGSCKVGVESTVLDCLRNPPVILRPGGISYEQLLPFIPDLKIYKKNFQDLQLEQIPSTPGMKYRHYSPEATLYLFRPHSSLQSKNQNQLQQQRNEISKFLKSLPQHLLVGYLRLDMENDAFEVDDHLVDKIEAERIRQFNLGSSNEEIASRLFAGLRAMDAMNVDLIIAEGVTEDEEGLAIMNRLEKAASKIIDC